MKKILVNKRSYIDQSGKADITTAKHIIQDIVCRYPDGRVKTSSGDIWKVKQVSHSEYDCIAIR